MIASLRLQHFRSYVDESFEFEPGVNIIVGPNGSGKTNLLEALLTVATGSSYRVGDEELIQFGAEWARLDAISSTQSRTVKLQRAGILTTKSYTIDDKPFKLLTLQHKLPVVLFEPNHLFLLSGQPELRRAYVDNLLEQTRPGYATTRRHYKRALAQRNALLKSSRRPSNDQLFVWNLRLSELGGVIARARAELLTAMHAVLPELYNSIAGTTQTETAIQYMSKLHPEGYESALLKALEKSYEHDMVRGFTTYGPHRDDFMISFNGKPAVEVASRGEVRTALLALKIYELQVLEQVRGQKPLLLLDDVFSELDGRRRHALATYLHTHQTFITTTDADLVLEDTMKDTHVIPVSRAT